MIFSGNFHTHTVFCDGKNTAEEMAAQALSLGFTHLGFSGHMDPEIRMDLPAYEAKIRQLREVYQGKLDILRGVEWDILYSPRDDAEQQIFDRLEYTIGSTHYIEPEQGALICVDDTPERFAKGCRQYFGGDYYRLAKAYYDLEAQVYDRLHCTFVGHFDLVTRFNDDLRYLDETDPRYYMPALEAMEYLVSKGVPFEINCGAINRGRKAEPYPNRFLLRHLCQMGGEILISSDAHQKELLDGGLDTAARIASECGFQHMLYLTHDDRGRVVMRQAPLTLS